jgi:hypothetical protein
VEEEDLAAAPVQSAEDERRRQFEEVRMFCS